MYTDKDKLTRNTYDRLTKHAAVHAQHGEKWEAMFFDRWATLIYNLYHKEKLQ